MRNKVRFVPQRSSGNPHPVLFKVIGIVSSLMIIMNNLVEVTASEVFSDMHVRSMTYIDHQKELTIPVFVASFGDPIVFPKGANLMYPPIDDDGYLCNLPPSFQNVHAWNKTTRYTGSLYSIGLFVKYGGNCTAQRKAEVIYEIQQYFPNVDMLLIYSTTSPAEIYDYDHQPTLLLPDTIPVPVELESMSLLYVKYNDAVKIINEIAVQEKMDETKSANFNPDPHSTNTSTRWTFNFIISGLPRDESGYYDNRYGTDNDDENPINFFWFRFVLFGLLIIAPCIRAFYLWYAGGGRIYFRRSEQTGRIIGLQYIPPIATWLAMGPTRLQQPSTSIWNVISEEDFNNLPEILYTAPIITTKHDVEEQSPIVSAPSGKVGVPPTDRDTAESNHLDPLVDIIDVNNIVRNEQESLNTSFNSTAEKGFIGVVDGDDEDKAIPTTMHSKNGNALSVSNIDEDLAHTTATTTSSIATTTCTICSICIDDFTIGETLIFLPRYVLAF